jgi:hypothetical protein
LEVDISNLPKGQRFEESDKSNGEKSQNWNKNQSSNLQSQQNLRVTWFVGEKVAERRADQHQSWSEEQMQFSWNQKNIFPQ